MKSLTWQWAALSVLIVGAISAVPLFFVTYPPLQDLPNHLARIVVLTAKASHPVRSFYDVAWGLIPNLSTDVILVGLSKLMSLALASKVLLTGCTLMWLVAPFLIHWAVYRQVSLIPLMSSIFLYNRVVQDGFLNFFFSTGLVGLGFALWVLLQNRHFMARALFAVVFATLVYFSHLFAFAVFIAAIAVWELLDASGTRIAQGLGRRLLLLAIAIAPGLVCFVLGPHDTMHNALFSFENAHSVTDVLVKKGTDIQSFLIAGPAFSLALIGLLALLVLVLCIGKTRGLDARLGYICAMQLVLLIALPPKIMDGANVDWRMLAPLVIFTGGWLRWEMTRRQVAAYTVAVTALVAIQIHPVTAFWQAGERLYRQFEVVNKKIPMEQRVVYAIGSVDYGRVENVYATWHFGGYSVIERRAMVPSLFAYPTQQPIRVKRKFLRLNHRLGNVIQGSAYRLNWKLFAENFDYVTLASTRPPKLGPEFQRVAQSGIFTLYKIVRISKWAPPLSSLVSSKS